GPAELGDASAARLWALAEGADTPVRVHCASENRAGALLEVGATRAGAMTPEEALAFGRSAGNGEPGVGGGGPRPAPAFARVPAMGRLLSRGGRRVAEDATATATRHRAQLRARRTPPALRPGCGTAPSAAGGAASSSSAGISTRGSR